MTIFGPFSKETDFSVERNNNGWSNFRVDDLDWLVGQPNGKWNRAGNLNEWNSEVGRFARIHDSEGNPVELWEPAQD
ncbi:hypothetical protein WGR33_20705 (plasmid) [Sinorhizobium meliloti]|nr:hypothetical protein [Sinorhizobium medicae]WQO48499.1 hypothetical protein U8C42_27905 [Sinorhizobium medicae]